MPIGPNVSDDVIYRDYAKSIVVVHPSDPTALGVKLLVLPSLGASPTYDLAQSGGISGPDSDGNYTMPFELTGAQTLALAEGKVWLEAYTTTDILIARGPVSVVS